MGHRLVKANFRREEALSYVSFSPIARFLRDTQTTLFSQFSVSFFNRCFFLGLVGVRKIVWRTSFF